VTERRFVFEIGLPGGETSNVVLYGKTIWDVREPFRRILAQSGVDAKNVTVRVSEEPEEVRR
jgi:hypothetical protein